MVIFSIDFNLQSISRKSCNYYCFIDENLRYLVCLKLDLKVNAVRMIGNSKHSAGGHNLFILSYNEANMGRNVGTVTVTKTTLKFRPVLYVAFQSRRMQFKQ